MSNKQQGAQLAQWEKVTGGFFPCPETLRLAVPGGWIYFLASAHREPCAVFVPMDSKSRMIDETMLSHPEMSRAEAAALLAGFS